MNLMFVITTVLSLLPFLGEPEWIPILLKTKGCLYMSKPADGVMSWDAAERICHSKGAELTSILGGTEENLYMYLVS